MFDCEVLDDSTSIATPAPGSSVDWNSVNSQAEAFSFTHPNEEEEEFAVADAYAHLRISGSSAMPDPSSPYIPRLKAQVHQRLTLEECAHIKLSDLTYRPLQHQDWDEMKALHTEWFPVYYDDTFFQRSVAGDIYSIVASRSSGADGPEDLLGIVTMSTHCEHHALDICRVLGADCQVMCRHGNDCQTQNFNDGENPPPDHCAAGAVGYILTLGVVDGFRKRGLGKELLQRLVEQVDLYLSHVRALYLHVVTYNSAAVALYESMKFTRIAHMESFYLIHGQQYDSFMYVYYLRRGGAHR